MRFYRSKKTALIGIVIAAMASSALSQDSFDDDVELLPNRKLEKRGERISGPITSIAAAGLLFASYDTNSDYSVDTVEFSKGQAKSFDIADSDKSGMVSLFELEDWRQAALGSLDAPPGNIAFDKDYDQRITAEEFEHALRYVYQANDKNKNGMLSFEEMTHVFEMPRRPILEEKPDPIETIERRGQRTNDRIGRRR